MKTELFFIEQNRAVCGLPDLYFYARGTPSVIACGDATFPKGTAFRGGGKVYGVAQRRHLEG